MTPLEALEKLTNYKCSCMSEKIECKEIIETALKEYECRKTLLENIDNDVIVFEPKEVWEEKQKRLKALKIIKDKSVDMLTLAISHYVQTYNDNKTFGAKLTEEEYDLLKEVSL